LTWHQETKDAEGK
jgi:hypothetical protein